jgi:hypothetical protein
VTFWTAHRCSSPAVLHIARLALARRLFISQERHVALMIFPRCLSSQALDDA